MRSFIRWIYDESGFCFCFLLVVFLGSRQFFVCVCTRARSPFNRLNGNRFLSYVIFSLFTAVAVQHTYFSLFDICFYSFWAVNEYSPCKVQNQWKCLFFTFGKMAMQLSEHFFSFKFLQYCMPATIMLGVLRFSRNLIH